MKRAGTSAWVAGALAALAGTSAWAVFSPQSQLLGPVLIAPRLPGRVALTFDDGPNPDATPRLLDVLARHRVLATFFLIGENVRREPALTRRIAREGHVIGNHTMTHRWLPCLSHADIRTELRDCAHALEDTLGAPATLFRPPHGARTPAVLAASRALGMTTVNWNVIVSDWRPQTPAALATRIADGIAKQHGRGFAANVVLHDGGHGQPRIPTVEAVDRLLADLAWRSRYAFTNPAAWL